MAVSFCRRAPAGEIVTVWGGGSNAARRPRSGVTEASCTAPSPTTQDGRIPYAETMKVNRMTTSNANELKNKTYPAIPVAPPAAHLPAIGHNSLGGLRAI